MATSDVKTPQKFSVPGPFYWSVKTVHAAAPLFVGLGNLESAMLARRIAAKTVDRPVYICGLPRAGTTITLQMLAEHPDVVTHKYADFLMPYTPYAWNKIFPKIPVDAMRKPVPRIHRDRIDVTRDSAEMGEEILWEHFFPHIHSEANYSVLDGSISNPAFERFYNEHLRKLAIVRGRDRYVSKAILCVLRMQYLRKIFPDARFLLYVRNPIDHIASITKQDRIWAELEKSDPRQIEIIELTGHHEFGTRQVMANVGDPQELHEIRRLFDEGHWAESRGRYWAYVYGFIVKQIESDPELARRVLIVRYEDLCSDSLATIDRILAHTELDAPSFADSRTKYGEKLSFPDYYKPKFEPQVLEAIVAATSDVAKHFNYDVAAIAGRVGAPTP
ncbi:MAG TPA: sulfotransferase [Candidatus Nitrosotalea sp.]|nr:sulfotransferase [Candidatus Nitrosotalea sp.]